MLVLTTLISKTKVDVHAKLYTYYMIHFISNAKTSKMIFGVQTQDSGYLWENN